MAKTKRTDKDLPKIPAVDYNLNLYNLTDLFWSDYNYHTDKLTTYMTEFSISKSREVTAALKPVSRHEGLKLLEAMYLGLRPFPGQKGVSIQKPNQNLGYLRQSIDYLVLPYKAVFSERDFARVEINRDLYTKEKISAAKQEQDILEQGGIENKPLNAEISIDVSSAFNKLLLSSKKIQEAHEQMPKFLVLDGFAAFLHSAVDWEIDTIHPLELITEPQARFDPDNWTRFSVIRKMTAAEAIDILQNPGDFPHWNGEAIRWAMETSVVNKGLIDHRKYARLLSNDEMEMQAENFAIRSFYQDKNIRMSSLASYYGSFYIIESYYRNKNKKITKDVFYPSTLFSGTSAEIIKAREAKPSPSDPQSVIDDRKLVEGADVLFRHENAFEKMSDAVTVIPFSRQEPVLERQRAYGHELYPLCDNASRIDSSITTAGYLMGEIFYRNKTEGTDANDIQDREAGQFGGGIDISTIELEENPFEMNLQGLVSVRQMYINQLQSKCFLGGLDNTETMGEGRGAQLANLRLIKDGRVHKHAVEDFAAGLRELYSKILSKVLSMSKLQADLDEDPRLQYFFIDQLTKVDGYDKKFLEFDKKDIVPDTRLPYWMSLESIRNGASQFGAVETVLYNEVKTLFGEGLSQSAAQNLARIGIKSILGHQQMLDILGNDADNHVTNQDQIYRATSETAAILGSVSASAMKFVAIPVLVDQDDHVLHLKEVHNPKANEYIQSLQNVDFAPTALAELSTEDLNSRNEQILSLAALASHISLHQSALEKFGKKNRDVNQLKEETNNILQTAEALLRNLQVTTRALLAKRQEDQARMENLSPENVAEQEKQKTKQLEVTRDIEKNRNQLAIANKIADQDKQEHMDTQLTKSRDRQAKVYIEEQKISAKKAEVFQSPSKSQNGNGSRSSA